MTTTNKAGRPKGKTGQAEVFGEKELKLVLRLVDSGNHPERNKAIVIISKIYWTEGEGDCIIKD